MPGEAVLTGELGLLSLFDLGQLLMLNGATGEMSVSAGGRRGHLYFARGQVVHAIDDEYDEGETAAYRLFSWRSGTFEFRPGTPTNSQTITHGTEGLMMEAARRMDEAGTGETTGVADRLAQRSSSLEALRLAFDSVASQARPAPEGSDPAGLPFGQLQSSSDVMLLRPHEPPRIRVAGRWRTPGTQALEPAVFEQLRARLLEGARDAAPEAGVRTWVATHDDGRTYEVTHLPGDGEALWVRAAGLAPLGPDQLEGPVGVWQASLALPSGLVLVCAPNAEGADRLLHACVAQMLRERAGTILMAADPGRWRHADEDGALLHASGPEAAQALRALSPEVAVFDQAHAAASADALHVAARVVVAVVAPTPAAALTRWCARVGRRWGDGIEALLSCGPVDVVHAAGEQVGEGRVPFGLTRLALDSQSAGAMPEPPVPAAPPVAPAPAAPRTEAPARTPAPAPRPESPPPSEDPLAALAAELARSLKKAA
jgi:hypothetical protein